MILDPLAQEIIGGHIVDGDAVLADVADGKAAFAKTLRRMPARHRATAIAAKS